MLLSMRKKIVNGAAPKEVDDQKEDALRQLGRIKFHGGNIRVLLNTDVFNIPDRITFSSKLTSDNNLVSLCLRTRSNDGYEREEALERIIKKTPLPLWAQVYVFLTLADYVNAISSLPTLDSFRPIYGFQNWMLSNNRLVELTKQRIISYWNEYYRQVHKDLLDYPAYQVFQALSRELTSEEIDSEIKNSMPAEYYKASKHTINHKQEILKSELCGCYCCVSLFKPQDIWEWITSLDDEFAMCPKCGIDAVLGDASGYPINKEFLIEMNKYWFGGDVAPASRRKIVKGKGNRCKKDVSSK